MSKAKLLASNQLAHVLNEKLVLSKCCAHASLRRRPAWEANAAA